MMNIDQLAEVLKTANVQELSRISGVSSKTIYRIRDQPKKPDGTPKSYRLDVVQKVIGALMTGSRKPKTAKQSEPA